MDCACDSQAHGLGLAAPLSTGLCHVSPHSPRDLYLGPPAQAEEEAKTTTESTVKVILGKDTAGFCPCSFPLPPPRGEGCRKGRDYHMWMAGSLCAGY